MSRLLACFLALSLAACPSFELAKVLDDAAVKGACPGSTEVDPPLGGSSQALWVSCEGAKVFQVYDGKAFTRVEVPAGVPAEQPLAAPDGSLFALTRDPAQPTTTNPRRLVRLFPDGRTEDRTAEVNPDRAEELKLAGAGGTVVVERGTSLYLASGDAIRALPVPLDGNFSILGVLPVLGDGERHDRFFLHVAVGLGSPETADEVKLFLWTGSAFQEVAIDDPAEKLRFSGYPRLFVPVGETGELFGIANDQAAQDRIVPILVARWNGTTLTATELKLSVEAGYFGPQQLFVRSDGKVVVLGTESEGTADIVNRLAFYQFTGEDFRRRYVFQTIQSCDQQDCDRSTSAPVFLVDGAVQYVIKDGSGAFEVRVGKL